MLNQQLKKPESIRRFLMKALMRRFSFLIYLLIFDLAAWPLSQAVAQSKDSASARSSSEEIFRSEAAAELPDPKALQEIPQAVPSAGGKPRVAVIELNLPGGDPKQIEKIADTLRDEFQSSNAFEVVSKEATRSFFTSNPDVLQRIDVANPLNRYLDQAKELYKSMDFKDAIAMLSNTIETYRAAEPPLTENFLLVNAYLYLGNVYMGNNQEKEAKNIFKEAVRLDPDEEITDAKYPPKTVNKFIQSKQEYLSKAKTTQLDIFSNPKGAEIIVNGVSKGEAPVKLDRFTMGEHFIIARKAGFKPATQKVLLKDNYTRVKLDLENDSQKVGQGEGLAVNDLADVEEQVRMAGKVGNLMGIDKVV
ncbi:MAG TPA: hypothetical protein DF383_01315, partial [Deltaproteobacteria bacterium]|nr:hypothetical protein [Deltaproteobacteria bacterium]